MKFTHLADCHLGGWRQQELRDLNLQSFQQAINISIKEKVDFVLIAGDLFDSAYPPIEILEETFSQLKKLKENDISCYIIAGSHDYSASGKTFLSVLEKAGFCENIYKSEEINEKTYLLPTFHKNIALYGYPGKKSGLEVEELRNIKLQESPGFFRIFSLHTCIEPAVGSLPIDSLKLEELPEADYYALGHLHINFSKDKFIYSGPTFPNNFEELKELKYGSFYIVEIPNKIERREIKIKDVEFFNIKVSDALTATDKIIKQLKDKDIKDKIVLLKLEGKLERGKISDIDFQTIENVIKDEQGYIMLKSISKLKVEETEIDLEIENMDKLEEEIIAKYTEENKSQFNNNIISLINALSIEKQEAETSETFKSRLFTELNKILSID
tara:strand:+ start:2971 stop:4125 length:1155 start_codon:yes stop_codon:yes gene_type:complete